MKFICYPKCTTCQKAKKWLDEKGVTYELRDIKENNPSYDELKKWYELSGLPLKKFFNTSGLLYKSMELKNKLPNMSEDEQLKLLSTDGMLVKRPLLISNDTPSVKVLRGKYRRHGVMKMLISRETEELIAALTDMARETYTETEVWFEVTPTTMM